MVPGLAESHQLLSGGFHRSSRQNPGPLCIDHSAAGRLADWHNLAEEWAESGGASDRNIIKSSPFASAPLGGGAGLEVPMLPL